ncbi:MAG: Phospholipase/carboxylesterase family protein [Myxococcaceae bacterium]|nr:Phospholipase/carboxylesterase family protein [Myxococcaceae bacterium]
MRKERFGELTATVTGGSDGRGGGDGPVVVLMHGFGAPGDDLVGLAQFVRAAPNVRFVFPEAPLLLDGGPGRAWWMLDMALMQRRMRGEHVDRSDELPPALPALREQLLEALLAIEQRLSVARKHLLLGGFSQGSMLACDVALHAEDKPAGLILLSSTLLARSVWAERAPSCSGLPILQTHGQRDPILPYADAERLRDMFLSAGADLTFVSFPGGHELPPITLEALTKFIARYAH